MLLKILSLEKFHNFEKVERVSLPLLKGEIEILPGHAETFFILGKGKMKIDFGKGKRLSFEIQGGKGYVKDDKIVIFL